MKDRPRTGTKKVYPQERRDILESYERGSSMPALAKSTGRNIRTIKSQLQMAGDEREMALARTAMYREALQQHNQGMIAALRLLKGSLGIPNDEFITPIPRFPEAASTALAVMRIRFSDGEPELEPLGDSDEDARLLDLAREHLRREKGLWNGLDDWNQKVIEYAQACYGLGVFTGDAVVERSHFEFVSGNTGQDGIHQSFISWSCRRGIEIAMDELPIDDNALLKLAHSQVHYGGSTIASISKPDEQEEARDLFLGLIDELSKSQLTLQIVDLRKELEDILPGLTRFVGDVLLLGLIPGRCSVCQKLGL